MLMALSWADAVSAVGSDFLPLFVALQTVNALGMYYVLNYNWEANIQTISTTVSVTNALFYIEVHFMP